MTRNPESARLPARLRKAADTLNRESDALTQTLRDVETALNTLGIGVSAQLSEPVHTEEEWSEDLTVDNEHVLLSWEHRLGYGKCVGKSEREWGLYVLSECHAQPVSKTRGIPELPRELRIVAAHHLPELLERLVQQAEEKVREVTDARARAEESLSRLES